MNWRRTVWQLLKGAIILAPLSIALSIIANVLTDPVQDLISHHPLIAWTGLGVVAVSLVALSLILYRLRRKSMRRKFYFVDLPDLFRADKPKANVVVVLGDELMLPPTPDPKMLVEILRVKAHITDGIAGTMIAFVLGKLAGLPEAPLVIVSNWEEYFRQQLESSHLIVIGSPQVNSVARRINEKWSGQFPIMPAAFRPPYQPDKSVVITRDGATYQRGQNLGFLILTTSCYADDKAALLVAGLSGPGTWAAAYGLARNWERLTQTKTDYAIVKPIDTDGDRIFDTAELCFPEAAQAEE